MALETHFTAHMIQKTTVAPGADGVAEIAFYTFASAGLDCQRAYST